MNIIELAQKCQLIGMRPHLDGIYQEALKQFAALVEAAARADEREECAKVCEYIREDSGYEDDGYDPCCSQVYLECADVIRARKTT
jgi:hypothetical protein